MTRGVIRLRAMKVDPMHTTAALNRYLTVGLDYSPDDDWNIGLRIPYVIRTHSTYGGYSTSVSFGVRYEKEPKLIPQLQLNLLHKGVDQGALADIYDTAGYVAYVSPGLNAELATRLQVYGFVQLPVYSDLVGYQLFPRYTVSVGASYAF